MIRTPTPVSNPPRFLRQVCLTPFSPPHPPPPHRKPAVLAALASANSWQWDAFVLDAVTRGRPLSALAAHLIRSAGLVTALRLDAAALGRWLRAVEDDYGNNPFHNRVHAADVLKVGQRGGPGEHAVSLVSQNTPSEAPAA